MRRLTPFELRRLQLINVQQQVVRTKILGLLYRSLGTEHEDGPPPDVEARKTLDEDLARWEEEEAEILKRALEITPA